MVGGGLRLGIALVVDEFALLLNLRDGYWSAWARVGVDVAFTIAAAAVNFAAMACWRCVGVSWRGRCADTPVCVHVGGRVGCAAGGRDTRVSGREPVVMEVSGG